jgi:anionic cell wall polymer biosynthesis LytR-Cps2A-Psr (LCP) family protein
MGLFPKEFPAVDTKYTRNGNSAGLIKRVITDITGIPVDAFVSVDFDGFVSATDILGGLDINVQTKFSDYEYPIEGKENELCDKDETFKQIEKFLVPGFDEEEKKKLFIEKPELEQFFKDITENPPLAFPCRYETLNFEAGQQHIDGDTALKYARSRHSLDDGGDFNRAKRQQKVLDAIKDKVLNLGVIAKIFPLMDELENYIETDILQEDLQRLLPEITNINKYETIQFVVTEPEYVKSSYSDYGQYFLIPNDGEDRWDDIHIVLKNIMLGITPTPTSRPVTPSRALTPTN